MRKFLVLVFLLASTAFGGELRDGSWWNHLTYGQKESWAVGWMDGTATGEHIARGAECYLQYRNISAMLMFDGMKSDQLVRGIEQFYSADFRNLSVWIGDAALMVEAIRVAGPEQAAQAMTILRERYK